MGFPILMLELRRSHTLDTRKTSGGFERRDADSSFLGRMMASTAALAYTLGLRHALDADHISVCLPAFSLSSPYLILQCTQLISSQAIDLMTRRLIADGQRPTTVGTFFSLGHSTCVPFPSHITSHPTHNPVLPLPHHQASKLTHSPES